VSLLIVFITAFSTLKLARKFSLPFLTISFVAMVITTFDLVEDPTMDGTKMLCSGFASSGFFAIRTILRLRCSVSTSCACSARSAPLSPLPRVGEAPSDPLVEPERRVKLEKARRRKRRIISLVLGVITSVFGYSAAGVVNTVLIVLIVGRFSDDPILFMYLSVIPIVIFLCALYKRWVFEAIESRSRRGLLQNVQSEPR
jgi:hypothetical protein